VTTRASKGEPLVAATVAFKKRQVACARAGQESRGATDPESNSVQWPNCIGVGPEGSLVGAG